MDVAGSTADVALVWADADVRCGDHGSGSGGADPNHVRLATLIRTVRTEI